MYVQIKNGMIDSDADPILSLTRYIPIVFAAPKMMKILFVIRSVSRPIQLYTIVFYTITEDPIEQGD